MNKKGFTLAELLGVIVVLSIIITMATISVVSIINRSKNRINSENEKTLKEAAKMYVQDKNIDDVDVNASVLIDEGLLDDPKEKCKDVLLHIKYDKNEHDYIITMTGKCED